MISLQGDLQGLVACIRSDLANPIGVLADGDFADLYVDGLETSQVAFPVRLNGQGSTYAGGHGDGHIRRLVSDQIIGDGGYIQLVHIAPDFRGTRGVWSCGIMIHGSDNDALSIDPTLVDRNACQDGCKTRIHERPITRPGYYTPDGAPANPGEGIFVTGITA